MQCVYLSHPIGPSSDPGELQARGDNLSAASRWEDLINETVRWAIMSASKSAGSSSPTSSGFANEFYSPGAMAKRIMLMARCDIVVQVGAWDESPHMEIERNHAQREGMPVISLLKFGPLPPTDDEERNEAMRFLKAESERVRALPRRRVWLPLLSSLDIVALRRAQRDLSANPANKDAADVLMRILHAAMKP